MSQLSTLALTDFLGFSALTLSFEADLTVLVGANGVGKTSILKALVWCAAKQVAGPDVPGESDLRRVGSTGDSSAVAEGPGWRSELRYSNRDPFAEPLPVTIVRRGLTFLHYGASRSVVDLTRSPSASRPWSTELALESWWDASSGYSSFFDWFREMEDLENEQVRYGQPTEHPGLSAVRRAVLKLFPEFTQLRIHRRLPPFSAGPVLGLTRRDGATLPFSSFSEGERAAVALVADLARRLALLERPGDPLEVEATVLVDEIEQHCHPAWQRRLVPGLRSVFPNVQWVWTTHSPVVVSECEPRHLRVLRDFQLVESGHGRGLDANAVLEDVFGQPARKQDVHQALVAVRAAVDAGDLGQARAHLRTLAQLTDEGGDWHYWDAVVHRLEAS
jgi:hypothetical protein